MIKALSSAILAFSLAFAPALAAAQDSAPDNSATAAATQKKMRISVDFDQTKDLEDILYLDLSNGQRVAIRLMPDWAPNAVERIKTLTRQGFYDGVIFHRVIDGFMAQTGDPTGTGQGGSELPDLKAEFNPLPHVRGTVSMARADDPDSANSQFFIMFYPRFALDKRYTNIGRVIDNMAAVDAIHRGEPPSDPTWIVQASIASDHKPQKFPPASAPAQASVPASTAAVAAAGDN
ncbi:peptidylprolyl isomerase [Croceibacterium aestuarii]|uniref:peptidylprolyl isomerase n=1 Tax=Croceibacterium aestuarii TaxID=3064139 RepID=UPI00272E5F10|nr:peptidylprolyl isomerase [Croceibacterium sp. D39]